MDRELRNQRRLAMRGVTERLGLSFSDGGIEMRAKPNGTAAGSNFEFRGYAAVYEHDFSMWDPHGEPYTESVAYGVSKRSLGNPNLDVPFLIGHNDAGIPLARTKSGTMTLAEDSHGTQVHVPSMDGRREEVRALASAVERGDMDEMSLAFICTRQEWSPDFEHRTILEWDLHRGDVCAVVHGANPATAGSWMGPSEQLSLRRPAAIGGPRLPELRAGAVRSCAELGHECCGGGRCNQLEHRCCTDVAQERAAGRPYELRAAGMHGDHQRVDPDGDGDCDACAEGDTDHDYWDADGHQVQPLPREEDRAERVLRELLSVTAAERDRAHAQGNSLPDKSYPINNVAQLHAAAVLAASHHGDWKAALVLIRRRARELGVDVTTLPGFGDGEEKSSGLPLEQRASAADNLNLAGAPDYDPNVSPHEMNGSDDAGSWECAPHAHFRQPSAATSAVVTVDGSTGIPGPEVQMAERQKRERRLRELELDELALAIR